MKASPKLRSTKDHSLFVLHPFNRDIHQSKKLEATMVRDGWWASKPAQVVRRDDGKLQIQDGHHRFEIAVKHGLAIWYVEDGRGPENPAELQDTVVPWSLVDFAVAYARSGNPHYKALLEFQKKHGLALAAAASLLGGESAGSHNKQRQVKNGTFKAVETKHAKDVIAITDRCRAGGIVFATATAFVTAVSLAMRVPEFNVNIFLHRVELYGGQLRKRGTVDEYLEEIEALYNYTAKANRLPVKFKAREISRSRQQTMGRKKPAR